MSDRRRYGKRPHKPIETIYVDVTCNDPRNGMFDHKAQAISIGDGSALELWAACHAPVFHEGEKGIRICRRWWPVKTCGHWVGNWCWNSYGLSIPTAAELLIAVKRSGLFSIDAGWEQIWKWWEAEPSPDDKAWLSIQLPLVQSERRP